MSQQFNQVKVANTSRSTFDLSHHQVTTTDFGYLIPICVRDMVPNDDFVVKPSLFCRLAPMAFPTYGRITCRVHSFFVPYRILYGHWHEFITKAQGNRTLPPFFTVSSLRQALQSDPQFGSGTSLRRGTYGRLMANLGLNPDLLMSQEGLGANDRISAFRFLAYYRIYIDYFMDSNINNHSVMDADFKALVRDGGSLIARSTEFLKTRNVCYSKDYFTTAKLNPQAGDASRVGVGISLNDFENNWKSQQPVTSSIGDIDGVLTITDSQSGSEVQLGPSGYNTLGFTVEDLRAAVSLQRYLERNNYVGSKVINQLLAHFGIAPTPERLDMAEYIGGSNFPIQIGDVTSTTPSSSGSAGVATIGLGAQAGKGIGAAQSETVRYHAKEHGVFMTLLSILPDTGYYQGIPKEFQLGVFGDPLDYYTPEFENLGFQEILNKEVYVPYSYDQYEDYDADGIFGYSPRYAFMKFQRDILAGDFVGNLSGSSVMGSQMDSWHLFRKLRYDDQFPLALNDNFVECNNKNEDYDRIFQVTNSDLDHFYFNIDVDVKATRPMVGFAEPSLEEVKTGDGNSINLPYGGTRL